jgi:hypothetical protein
MSLRRGNPTWKEEYNSGLEDAIKYFWRTRDEQSKKQLGRGVKDAGTRGAVTGGKQLNGLVEMMKEIAIDVGIPENYIYIKGNALPGYFRPTKDWDFIIVSPEKHLIACIEFKSQVGSFGNNFNNRVEEALGSSVDIHTAFRDKIFGTQEAPWIGYMIIVEQTRKSTSKVKICEPHFKVFKEFYNTSYLDRYKILCNKLVLERHYNSACLIWTSLEKNGKITYGTNDKELSFEKFVSSFIGFLLGKISEFQT